MLKSLIIGTGITDIISGSFTQKQVSVGLYFCNFASTGVALTLHAIKSGESASDANTVLKNLGFTGNETFQFPNEKFILDYGDKLSAKASLSDVINATAVFIEL